MIHVDRSQVPPPEWWEGREFRDFLAAWAKFHGAGGSRAQQRRMAPTVSSGDLESWKQRALPTLLEGFHGKCAYSEEPIDEKSGTVVFHRPLSDAIGLESDVSPEHYWWLLADWSNWYPASRRVASVKGTSFPVIGPRLDPPTRGVDPPSTSSATTEISASCSIPAGTFRPGTWSFRKTGRSSRESTRTPRYSGGTRGIRAATLRFDSSASTIPSWWRNVESDWLTYLTRNQAISLSIESTSTRRRLIPFNRSAGSLPRPDSSLPEDS